MIGVLFFGTIVYAQSIPSQSPFFYDQSSNITQIKPNTPVKISGPTPGGCVQLTSANIATTTGSPCGSGGGITSVTGTYPIQSTGGNTPDISTAFGTTTNWGIGTNGFVVTNAGGVPYRAASSTLNLPSSALANTTVTATSYTCSNLTVNAQGQLTTASNGSCGGTFPFTPQSLGNATSTLLLLNGGTLSTAASSTYSGSLHLNQASTTNLEMTMYLQDWPGAELGAQFTNAYAVSPTGTTYVVSASTTQSTVMNMNVAGKQGTIKCSPGVVINWVGAATSTILNATNLNNLQSGWGMQGCTIHGQNGSKQVGIQMGGNNGANGVLVQGVDIQKMHQDIVQVENTWNYDVNFSAFLDSDQSVHINTSNNSGEGSRWSFDTFGDCRTNIGDCFFSDVNGTDGLSLFHPTFDDAGIHLKDGNLNASLFEPKFENPGADAGFGRYTYMTLDAGGFMTVNLFGGTFMNGASTVGTSPWQFILNGAHLNMYGTTADNNTGNTVQISAFVNNHDGGDLAAFNWTDTNGGLTTVAILATSSILYAVDPSSSVIQSSLSYKIFPGGSLGTTAYEFFGEDAGSGFTDFGCFDSMAGYCGIKIDASPLLLNTNSGANVGVGTSTPIAIIDSYTAATTTANIILEAGTGGGCILGKDTRGTGYTETYWQAGAAFTKVAPTPLGKC